MADIFISYKREEQPIAIRLTDAFEQKGWSVWWDPKLRTGDRFDDVIEGALRDAKCVVVIWSRLSVGSNYIKSEATYALDHRKLVPIQIEEVELPFRFRGIDTRQLFNWDGSDNHPEFRRLVEDISSILAPPPPPPPVEKEVDRETDGHSRQKIEEEEQRKKEEERRREKLKQDLDSQQRDIEKQLKEKEAEYELKRKKAEDEARRKKRIKRILKIVTLCCLCLIAYLLIPQPSERQTTTGWVTLRHAPTIANRLGMQFVLIQPGSFMMGSDTTTSAEILPHNVRLTQAFYLQTTEVTQGQWQRVMGTNPSFFSRCGADCPVENVSWEDAKRFIEKLNQLENTTTYRLPSEAEWEYACRAGTATKYSFGDNASRLGEFAWYNANSNRTIHPVAEKRPNPWNLYDMHGNVWELVEDDWHFNYNQSPADGRAWIDSPRGSRKVIRGGSWTNDAEYCRSTNRVVYVPSNPGNLTGFRLAKSFDPTRPVHRIITTPK